MAEVINNIRLAVIKNKKGAAIILTSVFIVAFIIMAVSMVSYITTIGKTSSTITGSLEATYIAEAGIAKALSCLNTDLLALDCGGIAGDLYTGETEVPYGNGFFTTVVTNAGNEKIIISTSTSANLRNGGIRVVAKDTSTTTSLGFDFGIQADEGGVEIDNSASLAGDLFSNGPVVGHNLNLVGGDVISAGPLGLLKDINSAGDVRANTIMDSLITGDAYYQSIVSTVVTGTEHPGSPDYATGTLPITDNQIVAWEQEAETGTLITSPCPYVIDEDVTIGPAKITCDIIIEGSPVVTLKGAVWVVGTITIQNSSVIALDPTLGIESTGFIADNPSDRLTSSQIILENSTTAVNSGSAGSVVFFISQNDSAENGGDEFAVDINNSVNGDILLYAAHGKININNAIDLKQITGYKIVLRNNAAVIYDPWLTSTLFVPSTKKNWIIKPKTWQRL